MTKPRLSDLWTLGTLEGTLERGPYALWGVILFALKYNLDRFVAATVFHRSWSLFRYFAPHESGRVDSLAGADLRFFATLLLMAVPFIYCGVALTLRRLRGAGLPPGLLMLFFVPVVNLLFFALLSLLPSASGAQASTGSSLLARMVPRSKLGSAAAALLIVLPVAAFLTVLSVRVMQSYGWGLFVGLPFCIGLAAALLHGYHQPRSLWQSVSVALTAVTLLGLVLLAVAVEGAFCLLMAWPLGAALGALGGIVGALIQRREGASASAAAGPADGAAPTRPPGGGGALVLLLFLLPVLMGAERAEGGPAALIPLRTAVEVDAPPQVVWQKVVTFSELPPPSEWLFRIGIAYPQRAVIQGTGVGAVRHCVFSTGPFVEPIEVWDEPRLLKFAVTAQPPAMQEMSPWGKIDAPHISDFLVSEGGQFLLTPLPGGRTRVEGTTWYRHRIWPADYWRVWSDWILHSIHTRVLLHVKREAERGA